MEKKQPRAGKKLIRGTGFYTLSVVIAWFVILLLGAAVWIIAATLIYASSHFTAIIGWVSLGIFLMAYFLLRVIRSPFGRKLDIESLEKSGDIVGAVAKVAAVVADPQVAEYSDGKNVPGAKWILLSVEILMIAAFLGIPLLVLDLTGGDVKLFITSPMTSKSTFLFEASMVFWLILYVGYRIGGPIQAFIRRLIWGKRFAILLKK